jgi:flagellar motor switch protein FliN/FliY
MSEERDTAHRVEGHPAQDLEQVLDDAAETVAIEAQRIEELADTGVNGEPIGMASLMDVPVRVTVEVGRTRVPLSELVELGPGSLVVLDREAHEPADVLVNGKVVARGEIVTMDGNYGVRITEVQT